MNNKILAGAIFGIAAGLISFKAFNASSIYSAAIVFITVLWVSQRFFSLEKAWNTANIILNPFFFAVISFLLGFSYFSTRGSSFEISLILGTGCFFLGAAFSILAYNHWNI